jgi:hypothetical protein
MLDFLAWDRTAQLIKRWLSDLNTELNNGNLGRDEAKAESSMRSLTDRIFWGFAADRNVFRV